MRHAGLLTTLWVGALLPTGDAQAPQVRPGTASADQTFAVRAGRFLTMVGAPVSGGVMLVEDGKIKAIGEDLAIPHGMTVRDFGADTVCPGFVDLHHHVSGGMGDINDMSHPTNPELRTLDAVRPTAQLIRAALAGGVTTTLFIPGSGTNISGFGALLKMRYGERLEDMVIRELGAMKVAQGFNPERRAGDLGNSRMGSHHLLTATLMRGKRYAEAWRDHAAGKGAKPEFQADLEQLRLVMDREIPVIIHTAGARDCIATARMFQDVFDVRMILSHGTFNGHWAAAALAARKTPVNLGPRMYDFTKDGRFQGIAEGYYRVGCTDLSINTDAPVIPPEQLSLQAAMANRLGLPWRASLEALTVVPARQIGLDQRVGSLSIGLDADFFVTGGDPLDPRYPPKQVFIEGRLVYRADLARRPATR
jgi:imidazolonepropionase-like amidohydrolase